MPDQRLESVLSPKSVRVYFGRGTIADNGRVILLRETGRLPVYVDGELMPKPKEQCS